MQNPKGFIRFRQNNHECAKEKGIKMRNAKRKVGFLKLRQHNHINAKNTQQKITNC